MAVLYRKYRPQVFAEVLSQTHIIQTLKNQVAEGAVAHAYLFTGGRGVGKTSVARLLAKAVNCLHPKNGEPDGNCDNCQAIAKNNFLDLVEIDAASNTGVDNIRDLIEHVQFAPSIGKYKVFIIDEVHMLSKGAFNALLKTLEEPPQHALFVLATTEIHKIPATIISRTQRFDFKSYTVEELAAHLRIIAKKEKLKIDSDVLALIASHAQGSVRDALSLLDKVKTLGDNPSLDDARLLIGVTDLAWSEELVAILAEQQSAELPPFFDRLLEASVDVSIYNKDLLEYLRKLLVFKVLGKTEGLNRTQEQKLAETAGKFSLQDVLYILRLFLKSFKDLQSSPQPDLPLLLAALEACSKKNSLPQPAAAPITQEIPAPQHQVKTPERPVAEFAFTQVLQESPILPSVQEPVFDQPLDTGVAWEAIEPHWQSILSELKDANGPLGNLVKHAPVCGLEDGKIILGVKFLFHKQNLESQKNLKLICDIIEKHSGKRVGIAAKIVKEDVAEPTASLDSLNEALRILGGEVVD